MPTITSVNPVLERAKLYVASYISWAEQAAPKMAAETTVSNIQLRSFRSNIQAHADEYTVLVALAGGDLAGALSAHTDVYADASGINSAIAGIVGTIDTALDPDNHWAELSSGDQDAVATLYGLGDPGLATATDVWDSLHPDIRRDAIQHEMVAAATVTSVYDALVISYS